MSLRIGIDFDNTIINYHHVFYQKAIERKLVPTETSIDKSEVKAAIVKRFGNDQHWQLLQSIVYGKAIFEADCFEFFLNTLEQLIEAGHELYIVSHKTEFSHFDKSVALRKFATQWLQQKAIISNERLLIENVFFLNTVDEKVEKINELTLDIFIDDLDKVLQHKNFPSQTLAIAFGVQQDSSISHRVGHWQQCSNICLIAERIGVVPLKAWLSLSPSYPVEAKKVNRDGNNQIFEIVDSNNHKYLLKSYFSSRDDKRNRAKTEFSALKLLNSEGFEQVPQCYYFDDENQFAYYQFIESDLSREWDNLSLAVSQFVIQLNHLYQKKGLSDYPLAADSRQNFKDYFNKIEQRQDAILAGCDNSEDLQSIESFIIEKFLPFKEQILARTRNKLALLGKDISASFSEQTLTLNPSDLGVHNMLHSLGNSFFIDFEYFGLDDPAKMLADLFHHAQKGLTINEKWFVFEQYIEKCGSEELIERFDLVVDLIGLEWVLIVLNIAAPGVLARRTFANANTDKQQLIAFRLNTANSMITDFLEISKKDGRFLTITDKADIVMAKQAVF